MVIGQKWILNSYSFNRTCGNIKTLNVFGLARMATSSGLKVGSAEILGFERYNVNRGAKVENFLAAWAIFGWMLFVTSVGFAIEIMWTTWSLDVIYKLTLIPTMFCIRVRKFGGSIQKIDRCFIPIKCVSRC